ncbi:amidohydrolase [Candidatus Bathyarchaeota archaeon RBG_13_52_12]|nr:MAG: amidohydrolase [Candidatus Bathyarchaeota archaeon RBG_13_52_12]
MSDKIWGYAELGLWETKSSKLISDELEKHGFKLLHGVAGMPTAFVAEWGKGGPCIGVQGEFDALPLISQKVKTEKDPLKPGHAGHGCGHNVHGVSGMAGAIALRYELESEKIKARVKFFGTPAEENYAGKVFMVNDGLYDDVDACLSHHPSSANTARLSSSTAVNGVKFHYYGKTSHAAGNPEQGRSALDAIELMNIGVNYLREHIIQDARVHYIIEAGGGQPNVVPDYARSWYYIRAPERDQLDPIYKRILKIAEGAALMTETTLKVEFIDGLYNIIPNKVVAETVVKNMREVGTPKYTKKELEFAAEIAKSFPKEQKIDMLRKIKLPNYEKYMDVNLPTDVLDPMGEGEIMAGSSDVGDVSWKCPTVEFGTTLNVLGAPGHSWQFVAMSGSTVAHKSLVFAAKTIAGTALDLITQSKLLTEAKKEHADRLKGRTYKTPIPEDCVPPLEIAKVAAMKAQE